MKRITLSIVILGGLLNGFADECKHLWFSQKQQNGLYMVDNTTKSFDTSKVRNMYGKLENGNIVQYTEMTDKKEYTSNFDDVKYIGCGSYEKTDVKDSFDTRNYHSHSEINDKKYKEKLLKNYEQLNQK
ncbi:hypothetical protein ACOL3H_07070 [Aliarcobacter butzleri]